MDVRNYIRNNWKHSIRTKNKLGNSIPVPFPYTSPCAEGLFDELYYWDTYFLNRGLLQDKEFEQVKNNILDISYLISIYGFMPNAARYDMLTRSQPPFFIAMVADYIEKTNDNSILKDTISSMNKEMEFWINDRSVIIDNKTLFQYRNNATSDFAKNFAKEFEERVKYLVDSNEEKEIIGSNALGECESGWDFSPRFNQRILNFIPIDLNSIIYFNFLTLDKFNNECNYKTSYNYKKMANDIKEFLDDHSLKDGIYLDYDFVNNKTSEVVSMASFFPYKFGLCDLKENYDKLYYKLAHEYGLATTEKAEKINYQWSYPNVWPNLVLVAFDGAKRIKNFEKCVDSARIFTNCVEKDYQKTHKLWEKYDAILGEKSRKNEYVETEMLGWTAGTYSVLYDYLKESKNEEN